MKNKPQIIPIPDYSEEIDPEELNKLNSIISSYDSGTIGKEMLIQILQDINLEYFYLPDFALKYVSQKMNIPLPQVYHVATFYSAFSLKPRGKHLIRICIGTACHTRGAPRILEEFERQLEIYRGETTPDHLFTLETVNCLGCCAIGPVVMVDQDYHQVSTSRVTSLLKSYRE